jgi:hypothetical protein
MKTFLDNWDLEFGVSQDRTRNTENVARSSSCSQSGIALVITLILLAIITFLTITLLVVTRGEKGTVTVTQDQTTATLAADGALERVKLNVLAPMLGFTNPNNYEFFVSTNYINPFGYFATLPANGNPYTNVNYERTSAGAPLNQGQVLQNLQNLLYDPRPPVFMTNRLAGPAGSNEFRYYRDENRNGQFDATGLLPVIGLNGSYFDTNGNSFPKLVPGVVSNYFVGDPQWVGVLEKPGFPHSASNRFVARYAFEAIPLSKTLDINYIHNYSKGLNPAMAPGSDSFFRNMGVGTWEINFGAFLTELNTNFWQTAASPYNYSFNGANNYLLANSGTAFEDALSLLAYRYSTPSRPLRWSLPPILSVTTLFGPKGVRAFSGDFVDGYTYGPPMLGTSLPFEKDASRVTFGWSGSDNPNHFFSTQDFFDRSKTTVNYSAGTPATVQSFSDRLRAATLRTNSYDHYTFSRLMSQIGTDSSPESGKINLNYKNVDNFGNVAANAATNFIPWTNAAQFFNSAANRLLVNAGYSVGQKKQGFPFSPTNVLVSDGTSTGFSIQVWPTNFYTPSVHRLLQLAANIYDATTNRIDTTYPHLPSIFRPWFWYNPKLKCTFITNYTEVTNLDLLTSVKFKEPNDPSLGGTDMAYGSPVIIGAKKGFPNFNELEMETRVTVTRKLEFRRAAGSQNGPIQETNQMYVVGISNVFGVEAWNSYITNFPRPLRMYVGVDMTAVMTNQLGTMLVTNMYITNVPTPTGYLDIAAGKWLGFSSAVSPQASFIVPFDPATNHFLSLANSTYKHSLGRFVALTGSFEQNQNPTFQVPRWWLNLRTRLRFVLVDTTVNRIVDYVNLSSADDPVDLTYELMRGGLCGGSFNPQNPIPNGAFWCTNRASPSESVPTYGIRSQIAVSEGLFEPQDWNSSVEILPRNLDRKGAQDFFFYNLEGKRRSTNSFNLTNTFYSPFNPARDIYIVTSWQANDPLVHYTAGDLTDISNFGTNHVKLDHDGTYPAIANIRFVNKRYEPWTITTTGDSSSKTRTDLRVKDPLVTRSDDWDFPTNKFPNIGWLGRVHRGTPWQTIYLKSPPIDVTNWANWTGNLLAVTNFGQINTNIVNLPLTVRFPTTNWTYDILWTFPTNDWGILDLFTTALNDNAARGRLGINQTNLAAWSAIFSGVLALKANTNAVAGIGGTNFEPVVVQPVGLNGNAAPLWHLVTAINDVRRTNFAGSFTKLGDILAVPEYSVNSPFMSLTNVSPAKQLWSVNDAVCERLPQQTLGLISLDPSPRFLVFAYGQALKPAPRSIVTSGPFFNLCTNYQVVAEAATRTVFRIDGLRDKPPNPRIVIEKYSALPPD